MRFNSLFKYRFAGLLLASLFLFGNIAAQEITEKRAKPAELTIKVTDQSGNAIPEATVVVGEGIIHTATDQDGNTTIMVAPEDFVTVTKSGYEKTVVLGSKLASSPVLMLDQSGLYMTSEDVVPLPFMSLKKRQLTGSASVITGTRLEKYPSTDIRNAFTGLATGVEVRELNGSPGLSAEEKLGFFGIGEKINISSRGSSMMYIIDEIPTDITEMPLDPAEIESVTIIKDIVGKAMYGPAAADGIIFIKTRRGKMNERILNVNAEYGTSTIDRMPEFVSGADYARLNNLARANSGIDPLYSEEDITAYAKNDPYDMYHPSVNFREMTLKNTTNFQRVNISSTGGNDRVQYYSTLGYAGEGDIYSIGSKADYNRLNVRSNIDIKINDFLKVQFDFFGGLTFRQSPNYGWDPEFTSEGTDNPVLSITEMPELLNDITRIPPIAFPVYANNDPELKYPWYGVSSNYTSNPIGNLVKNGYYTESGRTGAFNVALEYDMSSFVKGLKSRTYIGFNSFNLLRIGKAENYTAYRATPSITGAGADTILLTKVFDGIDQANQAKLHDFYFQRYAVYENLNYQRSFGRHDVQTSLTYYLSNTSRNGIEEPQRQAIASAVAVYSYNNRFTIHGVVNHAGSSSYSKDARYFTSPTVGASLVVGEGKFINYLKIRGEYGILGYESFRSPYGYRDRWNISNSTSGGTAFGPHSSNQWFGSGTDLAYFTTPSRTGNPNLGWEKREEFNAGIDLLMANRRLLVEVSYYNHLRDGMINSLNRLPYIVGLSSWRPVFNYNQARLTGIEAALTLSKNKGSFKYAVTTWAALPKAVWVKFDEPDYRYSYQLRTGEDADAIRGQTYIGRFASDEEAMEIPQLFDEVLHAGDLKYKDMNGDGVVDDNDQSKIGSFSPKLIYALNARFQLKSLELTIVGTGRAFYDLLMNNRYFHNGWGDNTYSKFVLDNVMNNGTEYPRLTYYQVNNNFETSSFWLRDGGYFKIQNVELAWNIPMRKMEWTGVRILRLYARGSNLYTFSDIKDVDPEFTSAGIYNYPLFRTITGGIKLTF